MKSAAVAALAGVAAAASGPAAPVVPVPVGTGASTTTSLPIPTSTGNPAPGFQLRGISTKPEVNGLLAAEKHSTDSGKTEIVLARDGAANKLMMSQMTLTPEGMIRVSAPLRSGGSEGDYWTVGEIDPNTGMAAPQVVPAGFGKGFYLRNTTAVPTPGQPSIAVTPFPINTAPTTLQTMTTTTTTMVAQFPNKQASQRRQAAALPQYLGYKDAQGREAQFYACTGLDASKPSGPTGTGRPTGTGAPFPVRPEVGPETPVGTGPPAGPPAGTGITTGTATFPTPTGNSAEVQQLMFGFGTQPVPKTCAPVFLQTIHQ